MSHSEALAMLQNNIGVPIYGAPKVKVIYRKLIPDKCCIQSKYYGSMSKIIY